MATETEKPKVSIDDQIADVKREIALRERCYPKWIGSRLTQEKADKQLAAMEATLESLMSVKRLELAFDELVNARQVLISANYEPIMREIEHFNSHRAVRAEPLSFHLKQLVDWNQQVQIARDAFRKELARLEYTPEQLKKLYDDELARGDREKLRREGKK